MYKVIEFSKEELKFEPEAKVLRLEAILKGLSHLENVKKMDILMITSSLFPPLSYLRYNKIYAGNSADSELELAFKRMRYLDEKVGMYQYLTSYTKEGFLKSFGVLFYMEFQIDDLGNGAYSWLHVYEHLRRVSDFLLKEEKEKEKREEENLNK